MPWTYSWGRLSSRPFLLAGLGLLAACAHAPRTASLQDESRSQWTSCAVTAPAERSRFDAEMVDTGLPTQGQWRDGFDLADMNGDGHLDLLHGPSRKGPPVPVIFLGDGKGGFRRWEEAHFPPMPFDYGDAKAADFNQDGRLDIAVSSHLRGLAVLISEGGGHYAPWGEGLTLRAAGDMPDETLFASRAIAVGDWDGDGRVDLLATNEGPSRFVAAPGASEAMAVFLNRFGVWERVESRQLLRGFGDAIALGDLDGDRRLDAVIGSQNAGVRLLWQRPGTEGVVPSELVALAPASAVTAVALHDFEDDGRDDLVAAVRSFPQAQFCVGLQRIRIDADGGQRPDALWIERGKDSVVAITHGDIDRDGHDDLVALRQNGGLMTFRGEARGFRRDADIPAPSDLSGCDGFDARLADLDGDQRLELVVAYAGENDALGDRGSCASRGGFKVWRLGGK